MEVIDHPLALDIHHESLVNSLSSLESSERETEVCSLILRICYTHAIVMIVVRGIANVVII